MKMHAWWNNNPEVERHLLPYRKHADSLMVASNVFLTLVCMALAPLHDTWAEFALLALPTLGLSCLFWRMLPGQLLTRLFMACAFMAYSSLIIHQSHGDIEAHFSAFGLIGVLLYYRDWRTIAAATTFIYLQHLLAGYAQSQGAPVYVFDTSAFWSTFAIHVAYFLPFVGMMGVLSVWLQREAVSVQRMLANAQATELELRDAMEKAEVANRLKGEFLANTSHELRTPLNGILGMLELVRDTPVNAQQKAHLDVAQQSCTHLSALLNDILEFSRMESGAVELQLRPTSLSALCATLQAAMLPLAQQQQCQLHMACDDSVPPWLLADEVRLRQILTNLVGNALKHAPGGQVQCQLSAQPTGLSQHIALHMRVQDNGEGFPSHRAQDIFEPFVQVDGSSTRKHGGVGLGLAITRGLVQLFGGQISAQSAPGQGACFDVSLPLQVVSGPQTAPAAAAAAIDAQPRVLRVLVAEDHLINQRVIRLMLQKLGHQITIVDDGQAALQALHAQTFDVLLLDVMMPHKDGIEVLRLWRAHEQVHPHSPRLPIVMVTARALAGDAEHMLALGADGYLSKPITLEALARTLAQTQKR